MQTLIVVGSALVGALLIVQPVRSVLAEPPAPPAPKKPYDPAAAVNAALAASQRHDTKALEAVSLGEVDPWIVATMLLERSEATTAADLAVVAPRPDTKGLPAYVARHIVGPKDAALRTALQASADALAAGKTGEAIAICDAGLRDAKDLLRIQFLHARALARVRERQSSEAAADFSRAGDEAEAMGWFKRAATLRDLAGMRWLELGENVKALREFEKEVALDERRQVPEHLVTSLSHLATACGRTGETKRVLALLARAIPLAEGVGDRKTLIVLLNNQGTALRQEGRAREALALHERAVIVAREAGDHEAVARSDGSRGLTLRDLGDTPGAVAALASALEAHLASGSRAHAIETRIQLSPLQRLIGDRAAAKATAIAALGEAEALGDEALLAQAWACMASVRLTDGDLAEAKALLERSRAVQEKRGVPGELVRTLKMLAIACVRLGERRQALVAGTDAVALARAKGTAQDLAIALDALSLAHTALGEPDRAIESAEEALALYERLGHVHEAATEWDRIGRAKVELGDAEGGLALLERACVELRKSGDVFRLAMAESTIGEVHEGRGAWVPAATHHERALALLQKLGDDVQVGHEMMVLGRIWRNRGELGRSLEYQEAAERILSQRAGGCELAILRTDLARNWENLGELERAVSLRTLALEGFEKAGSPADAALEWIAIAATHARLGEVQRALEEAAKAAAFLEQLGDPGERALGWGRLGDVHLWAGDLPKALELARKSLAVLEPEKDPLPLAFAQKRVAGILLRMERPSDALASATTARDLFVRAGRLDMQGSAEAYRALAMIQLGRLPDALTASRASIELVASSLRGLGDEELARGWSKQSRLPFSVGLEAAVEAGRPHDAAWFMEFARGRALLELFGVRDTLRDAVLPPALRDAEIEALARRAAAGEAMRRATRRADAASFERARATSSRATADLVQVQARVEREAKRAAGITHPAPVTVATIQQGLGADDALVLYGSTTRQAVAVVVEPSGARLVALGPDETVRAACEAFRADDPGTDASRAVEALRRLLVEPLRLGPTVRRWIVSPDPALAVVPFALFDRDREVVLVPSATVLDFLRSEAGKRGASKRGEGVLALGDPAYRPVADARRVALLRSESLSLPIPKSGDEVREVGTTVLVREKATSSALREHLAKQRWRSVHLACHGVLDEERPALSGLALTPTGDDDGVLRVLDVFRLKVDADLVVLSACETARGKVFRGEGVLGLTRAFLYAGAPRVIASLWKVDDSATRALMSKFYARWAEGATPAAALRDAQSFVAAQPAWTHPHYWAAWTLWGLPN